MIKIIPTVYKDTPAIALENDAYLVTVLPGEGAKIVSFITKEDSREYLWQNPSPTYSHVGLYDSYVEGECSSFDDMFPTIDPIVISGGSRDAKTYPDHGEVCRIPFSAKIEDGTVTLEAYSEALAYTYRKIVSEDERGRIVVRYEIVNHAGDDFPCLWAGHCMLNVCDGGAVITALPMGSEIEIMFDDIGEYGKRGDILRSCPAYLTSRTELEVKNAYKYYYLDKTPAGYLGYRYTDGRAFMMHYDSGKLPYVGIWMNDGNFKNCHCVGLEPCNLGYDTIYNAERRGQRFVIPAGEAWSFEIAFSVE